MPPTRSRSGQDTGQPESFGLRNVPGTSRGELAMFVMGYESEEEDSSDAFSDSVDDLILETTLARDSNFRGSYAFGAACPDAPIPYISIAGLGTIGIPLGSRDAQAIISCSKQAPYGHGEKTLVNKEVRDTWEIEPSQISFENPAWNQFIDGTIIPLACQELGISQTEKQPKLELHKMLLYETGSHFLPHQDTVKTPGMFATVIILLPSTYTGGEVHVSHSNASNVFDFASSSLMTTSVLSWYTDERHEVKPITSGYRWALSYNFIQTSSEIPPPVPDTDTGRLARVLNRWRHRDYQNIPTFVAYILNHEYSKHGLRDGFKALKGQDAHTVRYIKQAADEEGFLVWMGNLHCTESGLADDEGGDSDGAFEYPEMAEVGNTTLRIEKLVDFDGVDLLGNNALALEIDQIVPQDYFEDAEPDDVDYEGYTGNEAGSLEHFYRRTVAVMIHQDDVEGILISAADLQTVVEKLARTQVNPPSKDNMLLVNVIVEKMTSKDKAVALTMIKNALLWKNAELWRRVLTVMKYDVSFLGADAPTKVGKVVRRLHFSTTSLSLGEILYKLPSLAARMRLIESVRLNRRDSESEAVERWCNAMVAKYLKVMTATVPDDVPILLSIAKNRGFAFIHRTIVPQLRKLNGSFEFWSAWLTGLIDQGVQPPCVDEADASSEYESVLEQCVGKSFLACFEVQDKGAYYDMPQLVEKLSPYAERVVTLVSVLAKGGHSSRCGPLFEMFLHMETSAGAEDVFDKIFVPIIQNLRQSTEIDLRLPVFTTFVESAIVLYLQRFLGTKPSNAVQPRHISCGCNSCEEVDQYIFNFSSSPLLLRCTPSTAKHLRTRVSLAHGLIAINATAGASHISIHRSSPLQEFLSWERRQRKVKEFLETIIGEVEVERIMGARYGDVLKAIEGSQPFVHEGCKLMLPRPPRGARSKQTARKMASLLPRPSMAIALHKR